MFEAVFITLNGRRMITFGVYRGNDAKGGMRFAFPPYGLFYEERKPDYRIKNIM